MKGIILSVVLQILLMNDHIKSKILFVIVNQN